MTQKKKKSKLAEKLSRKNQQTPSKSGMTDFERNEVKKMLTPLYQSDDWTRIAAICSKVVEHNPNDVEFLFLLGNALVRIERYQQASAALSRAIDLKPDFAAAYNSLGHVFDKSRKYKEACLSFQKATDIKPDFAEAWYNMGCILKKTQNSEAAVEAFSRVLNIDPNHVNTLYELPTLIFSRGEVEKAKELNDRLYKLTGDPAAAISRDSLLPMILPQRDEIEKWRKHYADAMDRYANSDFFIEEPQRKIKKTSFRLAYHAANNKELMRKQAAMYERVSPHLLYTAPHCEKDSGYYPKKDGKLRIGFVSKFFYLHSVSRCYNKMIEDFAARKDQFEVFLISTEIVGINDDTLQNVCSAVKGSITVPNKIREAQKMIADLKLDILIYTEMGMDQLTYCIAFGRYAPIQAVLAGHPDTTGLRNMDYFLSCVLAEPENAQDNYTETLIAFSDIPQYMERPVVPTKIKSRSELGLPEDKNLYSCPMKMQKMHPDFDHTMRQILERDPNGVIVLFKDIGILPNLLMERIKQNIPPELIDRVLMVPWAESDVFMDYLIHSDVVIDPFHFGGGTTCYMILSAGTPMVTWPGDSLAGRCGISCYKRMDMMELVAKDWDDYVDIAVRIGTDKQYRNQLKDKILERCDVLFANDNVLDEMIDKFLSLSKEKGLL